MSSPITAVAQELAGIIGGAARTIFSLVYEVSPIILTGGIATNMGGAIPIVQLTEGANFASALLLGGVSSTINTFFVTWMPLPGASLISNQVALYPFANQAVAANAIITQPLNISMIAKCPASNASGGYPLKLMTMQALQATLSQHNSTGGLYTVITPSFIYTNCIMTAMRDASGGETRQTQYQWQFDFLQPLTTQAQAGQALSSSLSKIASGIAPSGGTPTWTVAGLSVANPTSLLSSSLAPSTQ